MILKFCCSRGVIFSIKGDSVDKVIRSSMLHLASLHVQGTIFIYNLHFLWNYLILLICRVISYAMRQRYTKYRHPELACDYHVSLKLSFHFKSVSESFDGRLEKVFPPIFQASYKPLISPGTPIARPPVNSTFNIWRVGHSNADWIETLYQFL